MGQLDIIKIGWENAWTDLTTTVEYVEKNRSNSQSLVVSAMRKDWFNTTDKLKETAQFLVESDLDSAKWVFNNILNFHIEALQQQWWEEIIPEIQDIFLNILESFEENLWRDISIENDYIINVFWKDESLLWLWEKISALVHTRLLEKRWIPSEMVDMEHIDIVESQKYTDAVIWFFSDAVSKILQWWKVPVIWWYIWSIPWGILKNIDRWYTDATASLAALSQHNQYETIRLNIFKSVDGILWVDPRLFKKWSQIDLISHMDYLTARELTWGSIWWKAKFLHEYALSQEVMDAGIELKIMDPKKPHLWTTVSGQKDIHSHWVEIVNKRDGISFVRITKAAFWEWVGDVEKIFDIVKSKWLSIDMVTTSETQVSFSLEVSDNEQLEDLKTSIVNDFFQGKVSAINYVETQTNMSLVHCIGQNLDDRYQISLAYGILALENQGIKIHTVWWERKKWAIIFAVEQKDAIKSVQTLAKQFHLVKENK